MSCRNFQKQSCQLWENEVVNNSLDGHFVNHFIHETNISRVGKRILDDFSFMKLTRLLLGLPTRH